MKKYILVGCALAGLAFGVGSAMAADAPVATSYDWSGPYVGIIADYGWANSQHCDGICDGAAFGPAVSSKGFGAGLELGYNFQMDNLVFGVEGDYSLANINGSSPSTPTYGCSTGCETDINGYGSFRARLGFAADNVMPYITGGVGVINVNASLGGIGASTTMVEPVIGGGLEFGISENVSIKAEYLHFFNTSQVFDFSPLDCVTPGCSVRDVSLDTVRVGLNLSF